MAGRATLIPYRGPHSEDDRQLFGEYHNLVPICIEGHRCLVPENTSVLRSLQYLELKKGNVRMPWGDYCWNNTKGCCTMLYQSTPDGPVLEGRACQVQVSAELRIVQLPKGGKTCPSP